MQPLVSPDLKVYTISELEALREFVAGLRLNSTLACNLRQLLGFRTVGNDVRQGGFRTVGNDVRQGRQMAGNWPRLHSERSVPAQTCARSGRGQQCDPHFSTLLSRLQTRTDMNIQKMPMRGSLNRDDLELNG